MQELRQPVATQQQPEQVAAACADHGSHGNDLGEGQHRVSKSALAAAGDDELVDEDGQRSTDRVDDDPFPAENVRYCCRRPDSAQHRYDNGWSGHNCNRAKKKRDLPGQVEGEPGRQGRDHPGGQHADGDHVAHDLLQSHDFTELECQAAFEEDDRD